MQDWETTFKILFELSSDRRTALLMKISEQKLKMQQLSDSLDMTSTETFRHLQRLAASKLVEKKIDSLYYLTPFGKLAISFLTSFNFISRYSGYFLEHDPDRLPYKFVNRLGELATGEFGQDILPNLNRIRKMVYEAHEYIWVIADRADSSHIPVTSEKVSKGLKFRFIMQDDLAKIAKPIPQFEHLAERKHLKNIQVAILTNEKESFVSLRRTDGKMDYLGFFGTDEKFRKWVLDLFAHYWERAENWHPGIQIK